MRIIYAIILAVSLIGCDDGKKKEDGDNAVGGGPGGAGANGEGGDGDKAGDVGGGGPDGAGADGKQGGGGMSGRANTRSGSGQTGGGNGGSKGLSTDRQTGGKKGQVAESPRVGDASQPAARPTSAGLRRASPAPASPPAASPSAELQTAGDALILAVLQPGIIVHPDLMVYLTAVNTVPVASVPIGDDRTRQLRAALALMNAWPHPFPTPLIEPPVIAALNTVKGVVETELANPTEDRRSGTESERNRARIHLNRARPASVSNDPLYNAKRAYQDADQEDNARARAALLAAIEAVDPSRITPVAAQFAEYMRLRQAAGRS